MPKTVLTAAILTFLAAPAFAQQAPQPLPAIPGLVTERMISTQMAIEAATAAESTCRQQGYRVSVTVVDRNGQIRAVVRGDGAGPHTLDTSRRKAYTSATFRAGTTQTAENLRNNPAGANLVFVDQVLHVGGGMPIRAGQEVVGAIGVGGAPGGHLDDACAQAGIQRISDRLQ
jgi:uncharacterized protein GlcG (DUF336 family)